MGAPLSVPAKVRLNSMLHRKKRRLQRSASPFDSAMGPLLTILGFLGVHERFRLVAVSRAFRDAFDVLIKNFGVPSDFLDSVTKRSEGLLLYLLKRDHFKDSNSMEEFSRACELGMRRVPSFLLRDGRVDPSAENNDAIRLASERGHRDVVELLLGDDRVDPSAENNSAIRFASRRGHSEVMMLLLKDKRVNP